jgi:hypothetical protein
LRFSKRGVTSSLPTSNPFTLWFLTSYSRDFSSPLPLILQQQRKIPPAGVQPSSIPLF